MAEKRVLLVLVGNRHQEAKYVQQILTGFGCLIKTRLGIHADVLANCSEHGLLFCELVGEKTQHEEMCRKLNLLKDVHAQLVSLALPAAKEAAIQRSLSQAATKTATAKPVAAKKPVVAAKKAAPKTKKS